MKSIRFAILAVLFFALVQAGFTQEVVGKRPYEMDWANRVENEDPPLIDFEQFGQWQIKTKDVVATFVQSRQQQIFGSYVGKLTYRAVGIDPMLSIGPVTPIKIDKPFDAVSCWIYGNNWGFAPNLTLPQAVIYAVFEDNQGKEFNVFLTSVNWEEWFLCQHRLTPEQIKQTQKGVKFVRLEFSNCGNKMDLNLFFDNFSVFTEQLKPLTFAPRKQRGVDMFPDQGVGTNNGSGRLPFPNNVKTILPDNIERKFTTSVKQFGSSFAFTYKGADGVLTYKLTPKTGTFSDISAQWQGRGNIIHPLVDGGVYLEGNAKLPQKIKPLGKPQLKNGVVTVRYKVTKGEASADVTYSYRLWAKSLVIDTIAPGGKVEEVRYGHAEGLVDPRLAKSPFYHYGNTRPAVAISGSADKPLFLTGNTDWYRSNSSVPFSVNLIEDNKVSYQGGVQYIAKTDSKRNDVFERFFVTLSPRFEEMLPNIPNPVSPWMKVTGTGVWKAHGAGDRKSDAEFWTNVWRWGMRKIIVTDHETGWRDGGESFTFRTRPAPAKGGDKGQYDYARLMQDKLGFVYGPYNNYTDFAPVNEFWSYDLVSRYPDNQLMTAWMRCYAPKPARAVEYAEKLAPEIQKKFKFSTAYCDVHTAVAPWERVDYDYRVPGAGTFAGTFYSYGEIMMMQKAAWNGPVYSEGNFHLYYMGLTDGNYAQDRTYDIPTQPWLVDIDLRKMHNLGCNFGMGAPSMFYSQHESIEDPSKQAAEAYYDRFFAATVAFGHPGFLTFEGGFNHALRSYYMLQQLHSNYTQIGVSSIKYMDANGKLLPTSAAVASGAYVRNQIVTTYTNGTVTVVNGNPKERMKAMGLELPPNGYAGWTADKKTYVISSDDPVKHNRTDYADTPAYLYVDGRGEFTRFPKAASNGIGICRILGNGKYEVLPYNGADCGFAIEADKAVALDKDNKEIGPAKIRVSRGLVYVVPVDGALSYILTGAGEATKSSLSCKRDLVVPGEEVVIKGQTEHTLRIPEIAGIGQRLWYEFEGSWIDFTVTNLVDVSADLSGDILSVKLVSHAAVPTKFDVQVQKQKQQITLKPNVPNIVVFDLGTPTEEDDYVLSVKASAGSTVATTDYGMHITYGPNLLAEMPQGYKSSIQYRGKQPETPIPAGSGAIIDNRIGTAGGVQKACLFMHPSYLVGPGDTYVTYTKMTLPAEKAVFRAVVGKNDGSYLGDGIWFKVIVIDATGKATTVGQQTVKEHTWLPIEADLSPWAGKSIQLRLVMDIGPADDSSGDWASWAEMRIESKISYFNRQLLNESSGFQKEPSPNPATGLTLEDLRNAKSGRLVYDGIGFDSSNPLYTSYAFINGINIGPMKTSYGNEVTNEWGQGINIPLTPDAIKSLAKRNTFKLANMGNDYFKIRRFRLELDMPNGRKVTSFIAPAIYTQPPDWQYAEGTGVPFNKQITVDLWFDL